MLEAGIDRRRFTKVEAASSHVNQMHRQVLMADTPVLAQKECTGKHRNFLQCIANNVCDIVHLLRVSGYSF